MKNPHLKNKINTSKISDAALLLTSLTTIFGAFIYYIYKLNTLGIIISLFLAIISFFFLYKALISKEAKIIDNRLILNKKEYIYLLIFFCLFLYLIYYLFSIRSSRPLISPWELVNSRFFVLYALSALILVFTVLSQKISAIWKIILISFFYFLNFCVALMVYKIGYGFDPFIHQAAMELIDKQGYILPKTPYYLGEYSLIIILHKISGLSIYFLNKFLLPFLGAFFIPISFFKFLKSQRNKINSETPQSTNSKFITIIFLLIFGFSPFILSTPQNLTYLFLILTILLGLSRSNPIWILILSIATVFIHPLSGIPALAWTAWLFYKKYENNIKEKTKKIISSSIFLINALLLPLALLLGGGNSIKNIKFDSLFLLEPFKNIFANLSFSGREDWLSNIIYFFYNNYNLFLIIVIIASLLYFNKKKNNLEDNLLKKWQGLYFINYSLVISYILSSQISFNNVISYEQTNYAQRILVLIIIFCLPFIIFSVNQLIKKIFAENKLNQVIWLSIGVMLLLISFYISYPRFDKYFNSKGYSTSQNDINAVKLIDKSTEKPYIVLANQQVSAAALKELGFNHYYQTNSGPIYFYPIPTGGKLYEYYLSMVYEKPIRETMLEAMKLASVSEAYLVINKYWHESGKIINAAKLSADNFQVIPKDEIYIFKYSR